MSTLSNDAVESEKPKKNNILILILVLVSLVAGVLFYLWFFEWRFSIYTNDAYVEADIATLSPKVSGYIEQILVKPNSYVTKGTQLFKLDAKDYEISLNHANLQIEAQRKSFDTLEAQIKAAEANLEGAQAQLPAAEAGLSTAQTSLNRVQQLNKGHFTTKSQLEASNLKVKQAEANIANINAQIEGSEANIEVLKAKEAELDSQIKTLESSKEKAQYDINNTLIVAPFDGVISNLVAKQGDLVSPGQRLAALVPTNNLYVIANYKETQIADIEPGIVAEISVDALDKKSFMGRVVSIDPATGSVFSIMPPQNATGNFTKVVQRVPVRIALPKKVLESHLLRAGMSVGVTIDTRNKIE